MENYVVFKIDMICNDIEFFFVFVVVIGDCIVEMWEIKGFGWFCIIFGK